MIQGRYLGSESKEFLPLPESYLISKPELCKSVEQHYREYRQKKVLPLFKELASCDSLLILADLPTMLNSGSDMCNDTIELVKACLDFCQPGKSSFESLYSISQLPFLYRQSTDLIKQLPLIGSLSQMLFGQKSPLEPITTTLDQWLGLKKIKRLVIAASKCDLVHESDRDHLKVLLRELFQSTASAHPGLDLHWVNLSAAVATRSSSEHHALMGQPELNEGIEEQLIKVSELPEHWPHQWHAGDFCFPDFKPKRFPGLKVQTPEHYNLDRVFNHLMGWST
jgi:predicted YcjX-like family ATPase